MRTHKLLLPVGDCTVVELLLNSLTPVVDQVFMLVRSDDTALRAIVDRKPGVTVVCTDCDPPEMRASVELLFGAVERVARPGPDDAWLLSPADHPVMHAGVLETLLSGFRDRPDAIHIPTHHGRSGHPAVFPWPLAARVDEIPAGEGLNCLRRLPGVETIFHAVDDPAILWDLDTPDDYQRLLESLPGGSP